MEAITKKIINTKLAVERLLEENPAYRDNDERLVAQFWNEQIRLFNLNVRGMNAYEFLDMYSKGQLTSAELITRARRKVEELRPDLRGATWQKRQRVEGCVRKEINRI